MAKRSSTIPKRLPLPEDGAAVFSVQEAAQLLKLARITVYKAVHSGKLPSVRIGRKIGIPKRAIDRLLA